MSGREVIAVVVIVAALAAAVAGLVTLARGADLSLTQRAARTSLSPARRRSALARVRARDAGGPGGEGDVRTALGELSRCAAPALTYASLALLPLLQALMASPPLPVVAAGALAAGGNAVLAVVLARRWRWGRRFLAAHPGPGPTAGARR